jgi:tRNA dimethylallyltransferase
MLSGGTGLCIEAVLKDYQLSGVPVNQEWRDSPKGTSLEELTAMLQMLKKRNGGVMQSKTDIDTSQRAIRAIEIELGSETYNSVTLQQNISSLIIGVSLSRELRRERISRRLRTRLEAGMVDEVKKLLDEGIKPDDLIYYGLEYKYLTQYVIGELTYDEMVKKLEIAIHQFAKRQMTWFRGMERRGLHIHWIERPKSDNELERTVEEIISLIDE